MDLSRKWLREFTDVSVGDKEYADRMTMSGSKVEVFTYLGEEIVNVVVGKVTAMERHPNSDHLWICSTDVGGAEQITVVTGAQNVGVGDLVPVALDGSLLPGGKEIHAGELRGVMSEGMLCSLPELGLTKSDVPYAIEDGIIILQEDCEVGRDIREVLGFDDSVIEFEITSNRPDCLSVIGLARESAATFGTELKLHEPVVKGSGGDIAEHLDVEVYDEDLCPRYTARMIYDVKIEPSPKWMRERLRASGLRPINNIVDITNYVMLEYGQPMHAFDFNYINGKKIIVRRALEGEQMETLDGTKRSLEAGMLVIADEGRAVGIAGVMGGANSEITEKTKQVVFESANFNGVSIRKTALSLGMRTDASGRFEKGLDPLGTIPAVERACELVELLGAGKVYDGMIDVLSGIPEPKTLKLEPEKINRLIGVELAKEQMTEYLKPLGFEVENDIITVPSWRADVEHYSDIAEEVARLYGYDKIPYTIMGGEAMKGGLTDSQKFEKTAGDICRSLGYSEAVTYSFAGPSDHDRICLPKDSALRECVRIINPLGEDRSLMRTSSLPSMMDTLSRNHSYRNSEVKLYELARIYLPAAGQKLPDEKLCLTLGAYGGDIDFFNIKGAVEALFEYANIDGVRFEADTGNPSYHPGRCALITVRGELCGHVGQIHPAVAENYEIDVPVYAACIDFELMKSARSAEKRYTPLPKFPSMHRDIAVVCDNDISVAQLTDCIKRAGGGILRSAVCFDVYTGAGIGEGKKSVAFSIELRSDDKTLTDEDAEREQNVILEALGSEFSAVLR